MAYKKTLEVFLQQLEKKNKEVTLLNNEYRGDRELLKFKCNICGRDFYMTPNKVLQGQIHKPCGRKKASMAKIQQGKQKFKEALKNNIHIDTLEFLTEYAGQRKKIKLHCLTCDYEWETTPISLMQGAGCPRCANRLTKENQDFLKELQEINPHLHPLEPYVNAKTKIHFQCDLCGNIHFATPNAVLQAPYYCPDTLKSVGEQTIEDFLKKHNINYIAQYTFNDCRDKNKLPFDFFLPDVQMCIEYDGAQHFYAKNCFTKNLTEEEQNTRLQEIQRHDKIKNDYCANHNITMLRIKFTEFKNIQEILEREVM